MSVTTNISVKLDFNQVWDLVKQLPKKQQVKLASLLEKGDFNKTPGKKLSVKEETFLKELDEAVEFVNDYSKNKQRVTTFKQMLDAL